MFRCCSHPYRFLAVTPSTQPGDASLEVVKGGHAVHTQLADLLQLPPDDKRRRENWVHFTSEEKAKLAELRPDLFFAAFQSVPVNAGDFVLFFSHTPHQGGRIRAHSERPRPQHSPRFVIYVCAQPVLVGEMPQQEYTKRAQLFREKRAMAHWPRKARLFPTTPRMYDGKAPPAFDFSTLHHTAEEIEAMPVLKALMGLESTRTSSPLDALKEDLPPLIDFAIASGVCRAHPPSLPRPPQKKKRKAEGEAAPAPEQPATKHPRIEISQ